jgi:hypothetical protein
MRRPEYCFGNEEALHLVPSFERFFPALSRPGRFYSKVRLNDAATGYRILDYSLPD